VIDDKLAAAVEQIWELHLAVGSLEDVSLVYPLPQELAAFAAQLVAESGEFSFLDQKMLARFRPFIGRDRFSVALSSSPVGWLVKILASSKARTFLKTSVLYAAAGCGTDPIVAMVEKQNGHTGLLFFYL
jgi:hypothetical protein